MAMEAQAPVFVLAVTYRPDGTYSLEGSPPIWMKSANDMETELLTNTETILRFSESFILEYSNNGLCFTQSGPNFWAYNHRKD